MKQEEICDHVLFCFPLQASSRVQSGITQRRDRCSGCGHMPRRLPSLPAGLHAVQDEPQQGGAKPFMFFFLGLLACFSLSTRGTVVTRFVCVSLTVCLSGAGACAGGPGVSGDRRLPGQLNGRKFFPLLQWRGTACWGQQRAQHSVLNKDGGFTKRLKRKDECLSSWKKINVLLSYFFFSLCRCPRPTRRKPTWTCPLRPPRGEMALLFGR